MYVYRLGREHAYDKMPMTDLKRPNLYHNLGDFDGEEMSTNKREENTGNALKQIVAKCI